MSNLARGQKGMMVSSKPDFQSEGFLKRSYSMEIQHQQNTLAEKKGDMKIEKINEEDYSSRNMLEDSAMQLEHDVFDKVDRGNSHNPQMVSHVAKHIFKYLKSNEVREIFLVFHIF
jgi:hypothetical protein